MGNTITNQGRVLSPPRHVPPVYPRDQPPPCPEDRRLEVPILTADNVIIDKRYGIATICNMSNNKYYINLDTLTPSKVLKKAERIGYDSVEYRFTFVDSEEIRYAPERLEIGNRILVKLDAVGGARYSKKKIRKHKKRNTTRRK